LAADDKIGERMSKKSGIEDDTSALVFGFFNEIGIIEQLARTRLEKTLPDGLKMPHFGVLNHLVRLGKRESPAQLASAFQVTRPTMTNTVQRLEAKGYVTVSKDPADGRAKLVLITAAGLAARTAAIKALAPLLKRISGDLGTDLFAGLLPGLQKARVYLDENRD
jgi:DNA-binding MarR family transcriptional regulator